MFRGLDYTKRLVGPGARAAGRRGRRSRPRLGPACRPRAALLRAAGRVSGADTGRSRGPAAPGDGWAG